MIPPGMVLFHTPDSETAGDEARAFCKSRALTADDVRIIRRAGMIQVETKRPCKVKV
jgi:hypothetical protein